MINSILTNLESKNKSLDFKPDGLFKGIYIPELKNNEAFLNTISTLLVRDITFTKSNITPTIRELTKAIETSISNVVNRELIPKRELVFIEEDDILNSIIKRKLVSKKPKSIRNLKFLFKPKVGKELREILAIGNGAFKDEVSSFLKNFTDKELENIWNLNFTNNDSFSSLSLKDLTNKQKNENVILALMVATLPISKPSELKYNDELYLKNYHEANNKILSYINGLNTLADSVSKHVIVYHNSKIILVNTINYNEYINQNGDIDVVLFATKDKNSYTINDLISSKNKILNLIDKLKADKIVQKKIEIKNSYSVAYKVEALNVLKNSSDLLEDKDRIVNELNDYIRNIKEKDMENITKNVIYIVSKIFYNRSNGHRFLTHMFKYMKDDENLNMDSAATYATVDLLMDYLFEQIEVVNT